MIAGFTGHRTFKYGGRPDLHDEVSLAAYDFCRTWLEKKRPDGVICGMAPGLDTIWANAAIRLGIPVEAAIPYPEQSRKWSDVEVDYYDIILHHPLVTIKVISRQYDKGALFRRNRYIVKNSDVLVAGYCGGKGGTGMTIECAESLGVPVVKFNPKELLCPK